MAIKLTGKKITLVSLESRHLASLLTFSTNPEIWKYLSVSLSNRDEIYEWFEQTKKLEAEGKVAPFVIMDNVTEEILGSTQIFDLDKDHKTAEVGWTWLNPKHFGQGINLQAKLLLLTYALETLHLNRVQFKTDETNIRSQKALEKIGAKLEGTLRSFRIRRNGSLGNFLVYSVIISEWFETKELLIKKLIER